MQILKTKKEWKKDAHVWQLMSQTKKSVKDTDIHCQSAWNTESEMKEMSYANGNSM